MENTGLKGEMKMNRYSDMLRVPAQYEGSQRGNPFSEAVPEMLSYEELMDRLVSKPLRPEGLDDMSSSERRTALTNLNNLFIPMDYMYAIYDTLYRTMLSSYSCSGGLALSLGFLGCFRLFDPFRPLIPDLWRNCIP